VDEIDDKLVRTEYIYEKKMRDKINSIVSSAQAKAFRRTYSFYGLHVVSDDQRKEVVKAANETDAMLKEIDPSLKCYPSFFPIDEEQIKKDKVYESVVVTMKQQIYKDMIKRLESVAGKQLNDRMKTALLRFVDNLKEINVLADEDVNSNLESIKNEIIRERIPEIKAELEKQMGILDSRVLAFAEQYEG